MRRHRLELLLAALMAVAFALVCHWQAPGRTLSNADIDDYIRRIDAGADVPPGDKADLLDHLRAWGEGDDGRPVYMLNLMRYYDAPRAIPGHPEIGGNPRDLNAHYESVAVPMLLKLGAYPMFAGEPQGVRTGNRPSTNIASHDADLENWSRVLVVRYPDRRSFFELVSDSEYLKVLPYKFAALQVMLMPMNEEMVVTDLRWVTGAAMLAILAVVSIVRAKRFAREPGPAQ